MALKVENGNSVPGLEDVRPLVGGERHLGFVDTLSLFFANAEAVHRASRVNPPMVDEIHHVFLFLRRGGGGELEMVPTNKGQAHLPEAMRCTRLFWPARWPCHAR
tara:strand:- start:77 stop:391 length:315 start_codon:yes stop_codon:yes gene_type:complete